MSPFSCAREREVKDLIGRGHWPQACPEELGEHVRTCRSCSDLILVTTTFQAAHRQTMDMARLEPSGALWWRAQLRRRHSAIETMARPILGAQLFALATALLLALAVLVWQADSWTSSIGAWFGELPRVLHFDALIPPSLAESFLAHSTLIPVLATIALLSGVVFYLVSERR